MQPRPDVTRLSARGPERRRGGTLPSGHSRGGDVSGDWGCASFFTYHEGADGFCRLSLPVHHPDNALKDRYPPRNEPGTGDRGKSFVENLAWIYSRNGREDDWERIE